MKKRILSMLLVGVMLMTLVPLQTFAAESEVTRIQWLQKLTSTFNMTVEEDNYPDNYYSDISASDSFYRDVMIATEFGLIDVEPGEPLEPNAPVTREYAAHTLNFCLGYKLDEGSTYSFSDSESMTYADDAQIAVNRNWFALKDGKFMPEQAVTNAEMNAMLADAKQVQTGSEIDGSHDNVFKFKSNVKLIPEGTPVELNDDGSISYVGSVTLEKGDIVAVFLSDIPSGYTVETVTTSGRKTTFTGEETSLGDFVEDIDAQGTVEGDYLDFQPADGAVVTYVFKDGTETQSRARAAARGSKAIKDIYVTKSVGEGSYAASVTLAISKIYIDYKAEHMLSNPYAFVQVRGNTSLNMYAQGALFKGSVTLGSWGIPGLGNIKASCNLKCDGEITTAYSGNFTVGFEYEKSNGFREVRSFKTNSYTLDAQLKATIDMTFGVYVNILDVVNGSASSSIGACIVYHRTERTPQTPALCENLRSWIFVKYGISASVGVGVLNKSYSSSKYVFDENNSPALTNFHYEDGIQVANCTYGDYGTYYTKGDSRYGYGSSAYGSSKGLNAAGEPYTIFEYTLDDDNATIKKYYGNVSALSIPKKIDGYTVTTIGENVFKNRNELTSVVIPDTVTEIEDSAFENCSSLSSVKLSKNLVELGKMAFGNCDSLTYIEIPKSLTTAGCTWDTKGPFGDCDSLSNIIFEEDATQIPGYILAGCSGFTTVKIPNKVTSIGKEAFAHCINLEKIEIPDSVTKIEDSAFENCSSLSSVKLSKNLVELGKMAFGNCDSLTYIEIPKSLTTAGCTWDTKGPFGDCDSLSNIIFEEDATQIPGYILAGCSGFTTVKIPETVTKIGKGAFENCGKLESIDIPDTVTEIEDRAFENCSSLSSVKLSKRLAELGSMAFGNCDSLTYIEIPKSIVTTRYSTVYYKGPFADCDSLQSVVFEEGATHIQGYILAGCSGFTTVKIPETVTKIGKGAFENCGKLESIDIPNSVTRIENSAFENCSSLEGKVVIPDSVTDMGDAVFKNCSMITEVVLPNIRQNIMKSTFEGCTSLEKIVLPDTVTAIREYAFKNCTSLKDITWSKSINEIWRYAFENCDALEKVDIPDTVISIGEGAFYDCDALTSVSIPSSVTEIGTKMFYDCDSLTDVRLGNGITKLPDSLFEHCDVLAKVIVPYRVSTIGNNAFKDCVKLTEVTIPRGTATISTSAFSYPDILTIYGVSGTTAETYAGQIGAKFVAIDKPATKVTLSKTELTLNKGQSAKLTATIEPNDFTDAAKWKSSDTSIVTVVDDGTVKAVGVGTATVSFFAGNTKASCKVTVLQPVTSIRFTKSSVSLDGGNTMQLTINIRPDDAANKDIVWSSSDESVATVDQSGLVTALKKGTATITVIAQDGSDCKATCTVTVVSNANVCKRVDELQSGHPYSPDSNELWVYTDAGAKSLSVTFSEETSVEDGSDYIYIYAKDGTLIGKYTGTELAGKTIVVEGDTVKIKLVSDEVYGEYGFAVTKIIAEKDHTPGDLNGDGKVNVMDLIRLKRYLADGTEVVGNADVNGDGKVNVMDLIRLKRYIAGEAVDIY